jgi:hypothetical protein
MIVELGKEYRLQALIKGLKNEKRRILKSIKRHTHRLVFQKGDLLNSKYDALSARNTVLEYTNRIIVLFSKDLIDQKESFNRYCYPSMMPKSFVSQIEQRIEGLQIDIEKCQKEKMVTEDEIKAIKWEIFKIFQKNTKIKNKLKTLRERSFWVTEEIQKLILEQNLRKRK